MQFFLIGNLGILRPVEIYRFTAIQLLILLRCIKRFVRIKILQVQIPIVLILVVFYEIPRTFKAPGMTTVVIASIFPVNRILPARKPFTGKILESIGPCMPLVPFLATNQLKSRVAGVVCQSSILPIVAVIRDELSANPVI